MKKLIYLSAAFIFGFNITDAKQVEPAIAQQVAQNYILQNANGNAIDIALTYTETSAVGIADYYVFGINNKNGFIIISAEDAGSPVIGYSLESPFVMSGANSNFNFWLQKRKDEIEYMRDNNIQPTSAIINEWTGYANNLKTNFPHVNASVAPLCAATWDQSAPYNDSCVGGSITGCVATGMVIIMKRWNYPPQGTGSSSYAAGLGHGTLSANYGATTYNWADMTTPFCSTGNVAASKAVSTIMAHCGISVNMEYSTGGSYAQTFGVQPSAEYSYKTYFGYDPATIHNVMQASDPNWVTTLETEFNAGRPVQYQGFYSSGGGHSWVSDGYDATNKMHMNWGYSGEDNGYYDVNTLNPSNIGYFVKNIGALIGIQPLVLPVDAGVQSITAPGANICSSSISPVVKIQNLGSTTLTSCTITYAIDNNPNQTQSWTGSLATGAFANFTLASMNVTSGTHTLTCSTANPNGSSDGNPGNDQSQILFTVNSTPLLLPLMEGFESSANLPIGWSLYNPDNDAAWQISTTVAHTGTNSIVFNNCDGDGQTNVTGQKDRFLTSTFDFSAATSANMSFDVAYAKLSTSNKIYTDTLAVLASSDCGTTWSQLYVKGGAALSTAPDITSKMLLGSPVCFTPTSSQWRTDNIALNSLIGQSNVMFAFENRSGWGEGIYLDNINITAVTGIESINSTDGFTIYPNPASTSFTIEGASNAGRVHYAVYNIVGEEIRAGDIAANGSGFNGKIQVDDISQGVYFIKVSDEKNIWIKKLNVQK